MTCINTDSNLLLINLERPRLIHMPSQFTFTEANYFRQLLQQFYYSFESVAVKQSNCTIKKVILDFQQTTFIDNEGLIGLCQILRLAKETKNDLSFSSFSPQVQMVLSLAGLEHAFPIHNNSN